MAFPERADHAVVPGRTSTGPGNPALLKREVSPYGLGGLLCQLAIRRLTGRLELTQETGTRTLYLAHGFPVFSSSTQFSERVGAIGLRHGMVARNVLTKALAHCREQSTPLGNSLLALGGITGGGLFNLLSAQFVEQLSRACGPERSRATFYEDEAVLHNVAMLRGTALSGVLWAVRGVPLTTRSLVMDSAAAAAVETEPLSPLASQWLTDLGYMGDPQDLLSGATRLEAVRSKLMARMRSSTLALFDASLGIPGRRVETDRLSPRQASDAVTLTLLLSGGVRIVDPEAISALAEDAPSEAVTLHEALRRPVEPIPDGAAMDDQSGSELDPEHLYLTSPRDGRQSARLLMLGPSAELEEFEAGLEEMLDLYLSSKPGAGLDGSALTPYRELASELARSSASILCRTRAAVLLSLMETSQSVPANSHSGFVKAREGSPADSVPAVIVPKLPQLPEDLDSTPEAQLSARPKQTTSEPTTHGESGRPRRPSMHSMNPETREADQLLLRVEAFLAQERWADVVMALAGQTRAGLSPALRLALQVARQQERRRQRSRWPMAVLLVVVGLVAGYQAGQLSLLQPLLSLLPHGLIPR